MCPRSVQAHWCDGGALELRFGECALICLFPGFPRVGGTILVFILVIRSMRQPNSLIANLMGVDVLFFTIRSMLLHRGGYHGLEEALTRYEAGPLQGDPISALLYCFVGELYTALVLSSEGLLAIPVGP